MIARNQLFRAIFYALLLSVAAYHALIHWRIIWSAMPVTARETAFAADMNGYLDPTSPRPYTLASIPGLTNLYGIGYLWGAAPFAWLLPFDQLQNLRIVNAIFLGVMLLAIGYAGRGSPPMARSFMLTLIYALFVSSPSIAAGPDIFACLLYVLAFLVAAEQVPNRGYLILSLFLGFLAFLTKPYLVLVVPAIATYLLVFRSVRTGVLYIVGAALVFSIGLCLIRLLYPYYFVSIFAVHLAAASRDPVAAIKQWSEFAILASVPAAFAVVLYRQWMRRNARQLRCAFRWSAPILGGGTPISLYAWGAWLATAALAVSLSWHTGAYMIYFWHLLLPLLVLSQVRHLSIRAEWLCVNLVVLLVLRPPLPPSGASAEWKQLSAVVAAHPRIYLDPFVSSLRPATLGDPNRENAQSEYLLSLSLAANEGSDDDSETGFTEQLAFSLAGKDAALLKRTEEFMQSQAQAFMSRDCEGLLLVEGIFYQEHLMPIILSRYKITKAFVLFPYYASFRNRRAYGRAPVTVFLFQPLK